MREKASIGAYNQGFTYNFQDFVSEVQSTFLSGISALQFINFKILFPDEDLSESFPELNINDLDNPEINVEEVMNGFDWDSAHYTYSNFGIRGYLRDFARTNSNFDVFKIAYRIINVDTKNIVGLDPQTEFILENFKKMFDDSDVKDFKTKNATMSVDINR